jgi:hypothetical protein
MKKVACKLSWILFSTTAVLSIVFVVSMTICRDRFVRQFDRYAPELNSHYSHTVLHRVEGLSEGTVPLGDTLSLEFSACFVRKGAAYYVLYDDPLGGYSVFVKCLDASRHPSSILVDWPNRKTFRFEILSDDGWCYWLYN